MFAVALWEKRVDGIAGANRLPLETVTARSRSEESAAQQNRSLCVLDDDPCFRKVLETSLRISGFSIQSFACADTMLRSLATTQVDPDLFLVDYHLGTSKFSGLNICRTLMSRYGRPVIIVTNDQSAEKELACLMAGAVDYIYKSREMSLLKARIHARLRERSPAPLSNHDASASLTPHPQHLRYGTLRLDTLLRALHCESSGRSSKKLSYSECTLLGLLMRSPDQTLQRADAFFALYEAEMPPDNRAVDITISRIRTHLLSINSRAVIRSLRGKGYRLCQ